MGIELRSHDQGRRRKNDAFILSATLPSEHNCLLLLALIHQNAINPSAESIRSRLYNHSIRVQAAIWSRCCVLGKKKVYRDHFLIGGFE